MLQPKATCFPRDFKELEIERLRAYLDIPSRRCKIISYVKAFYRPAFVEATFASVQGTTTSRHSRKFF